MEIHHIRDMMTCTDQMCSRLNAAEPEHFSKKADKKDTPYHENEKYSPIRAKDQSIITTMRMLTSRIHIMSFT